MRFKWTVEIEVDETWVADGFELTQERLEDMLGHTLSSATSTEYAGLVLKAPDAKDILRVQGYPEDPDVSYYMYKGYWISKTKVKPVGDGLGTTSHYYRVKACLSDNYSLHHGSFDTYADAMIWVDKHYGEPI